MHSHVFNRCIGQKNARFYFIFLLCAIFTIKIFLYLSSSAFQTTDDEKCMVNWLYGGVLELFLASKFLFLFSFFLLLVLAFIVEEYLWLLMAVSRKITVGEYKRSFNYKYLFKIKTNTNKENFYIHRYYSLWNCVQNIALFLTARDKSTK